MSDSKQQKYSSDKAPPEFKTHGEKMYDLVFNQGFNFWANLLISAGFTYWVYHYKAPIWKGAENFAKGDLSQNILKGIKFGGYGVGGVMVADGLLRGKHGDGIERKAGDRVNEVLSGLAIGGIGHAVGNSTKVVRELFSKRPYEAHKWVQRGIYNSPFMDTFGKGSAEELNTAMKAIEEGKHIKLPARLEVAKFMADALTLTSVGTFVMIPGVWGAEKIKSDFIRWQDRMHYGNDAENISWIKQRHDHIDDQKRPTLIGYGVGRLGSMAAVQAAAYTFGHGDKNIIKYVGKKFDIPGLRSFGGTDNLAAEIGNGIGWSAKKAAQQLGKSTDEFLVRTNHGWSDDQIIMARSVMSGAEKVDPSSDKAQLAQQIMDDLAHMEKDKNAVTTYDRGFQDFGKYVGMDTIYTAITAGTIVPFTAWLKQNIPGLSYTQNTPDRRVSSVSHESTINSPELKAAR